MTKFPSPYQGITFIDNIEHLKSISQLSENAWYDLVDLSWRRYQQFKMGQSSLPDDSIENLCKYFNLSINQILDNKINFKELAIKMEKSDVSISDYYMIAPFSRRRTTITSIEFLEEAFGWRLKQDVLKHFKISESALLDPFAPISMRLITQICDYLYKRQFTPQDFYAMGAYSVVGNRNTLVARTLTNADSIHSIYEHLINNLMPLFETNSNYTYEPINNHEGLLTMKSNKDIAKELKVKNLGSAHICNLKIGFISSAPSYLGLPFSKVTHTECEHRGDSSCVFHVDITPCHSQDNYPSLVFA